MKKLNIIKGEEKNRKIFLIILISMWGIFLSIILFSALFVYCVSNDTFKLFGKNPSAKSLESPQTDLSSELYSVDNKLLGKYFRKNRSQVDYDDLSPSLVHALIAIEDSRFIQHSGIDLEAVFRVIFRTILAGQRSAGGGSTLTQQLAKNLFGTREEAYHGKIQKFTSGTWNILDTIIDKTKEWVLAIKLEKAYTKKEIIAMYLNTVSFGENAFGIKVAAKTFFNTTPRKLKVEESALLVGILQAPSYLSPRRHLDRSKKRRNVVMKQMAKYKYLSKEQYDLLKKTDIQLSYNIESHNQGPATYFRSVIRDFLQSWCEEHKYDLFEDGLKIYTTIDSRMQAYAEKALKEHMASLQEKFYKHWKIQGGNPWLDDEGNEIIDFLQIRVKNTSHYRSLIKKYGEGHDSVGYYLNIPKPMTVFSWNGDIDTTMSTIESIAYYKHFLHAGFIAMDPNTGRIKSWVGGINYKYFQYDHVTQGKRQPGSTFKPIVYAAAIDNGWEPCMKVRDVPITFTSENGTTWVPSNSNNRETNSLMTIRQGMARSVNTITAYIMKQIGPKTVVEYAKRLGIESPLDPVPSLCLGTSDVSIYELVGAYSTFINKGVYIKPYFVSRIEDKHGNLIQEFRPQTKEALHPETADKMLYMLRGSTEEVGGTGRSLSFKLKQNNQIGAKTGTTQNGSDGWFIGVTADLVAGAWVGGDERSIRFKHWTLGQGSRTAMPIFEKYMLDVYEDKTLPYKKTPLNIDNKTLHEIEEECKQYERKAQENYLDSIDQEVKDQIETFNFSN